MFNEAERSSIVYRDKRSASPSKGKKKERKEKSSTPSQRTFLPRSQRGRSSVSSARPLVSSAPAKVSSPNSGWISNFACANIASKVTSSSSFATFRSLKRWNLIENCNFSRQVCYHFKTEVGIFLQIKCFSTGRIQPYHFSSFYFQE